MGGPGGTLTGNIDDRLVEVEGDVLKAQLAAWHAHDAPSRPLGGRQGGGRPRARRARDFATVGVRRSPGLQPLQLEKAARGVKSAE